MLPRLGKGGMEFLTFRPRSRTCNIQILHHLHPGPNGMSDYRAHVVSDYEYVGEAANNKSSTTSTKFLNRDADDAAHPPPRKHYVSAAH